jgi:cell division protein FtsB
VKRLALLLAGLVLAIQWPLWFGHGGWLRVWDLQHQLAARQSANAALRAHNQELTAELASLRQGSEAIEERARAELHMLRPDETFFQLLPAGAAAATPPAGAAVASSQALQLGVE